MHASGNVQVNSTDDLWAIDRDANIRFGLEAVRAGAKHVILVATFEGRDSKHLTGFSDAKECAVDAIDAACRQADVAFTVIRPTAYFSDLTNRAFESVLKRGRIRAPTMPLRSLVARGGSATTSARSAMPCNFANKPFSKHRAEGLAQGPSFMGKFELPDFASKRLLWTVTLEVDVVNYNGTSHAVPNRGFQQSRMLNPG